MLPGLPLGRSLISSRGINEDGRHRPNNGGTEQQVERRRVVPGRVWDVKHRPDGPSPAATARQQLTQTTNTKRGHPADRFSPLEVALLPCSPPYLCTTNNFSGMELIGNLRWHCYRGKLSYQSGKGDHIAFGLMADTVHVDLVNQPRPTVWAQPCFPRRLTTLRG